MKSVKRDDVRVDLIPDAASSPSARRQLDRGLQHGSPALPIGLPITSGVHSSQPVACPAEV
jgi:hypothetical protein